MMKNQISNVDLTEREQDVLRLLAQGLTNKEIADKLYITVGTVKWYNHQIYTKLNVSNRTEAVALLHDKDLLNTRKPKTQSQLEVQKTAFPSPLTSFIGRKRELQSLTELIQSGYRLITLTGAPGVGKTRLSLVTAATMLDFFDDGVFFIPLAPIQTTDLVPTAIAQVLKITELGSSSPFRTLKDYLSTKEMLLVLDNYEHLLSSASLVSELLKSAPNLSIIVTSRETLRLYGEYEYSVPPLQLPDLKQSLSVEALRSYEAIDLLIQRTEMVRPDFVLDDENALAIATICVHLDGLPLAIELAAARMRFYAPQTLLMRLTSRLDALRDGPRDLPDRQRTLQATLAWSYGLLSGQEQILFARLGTFVGGFTQDAVEVICSHDLTLSIAEGLESLLLKNLIQQEHQPHGERRFTLLETMREYAFEKLDERNEVATLREKHALYFTLLATRANQAAYSSSETAWLKRLEAEHDNLRATIERCLDIDETGQMGFEIIAKLARFWEKRGYFSEARAWLSKVLELPNLKHGTKAQAHAFYGISLLTHLQGNNAMAIKLCEQALEIYKSISDLRRTSYVLTRMGEIVASMGNIELASQYSLQSYDKAVQAGDKNAQANAFCQIGFDNIRSGNYEEAHSFLVQGLEAYQDCGDVDGIALAYGGLGEILVRMNKLEKAEIQLQKSLNLREEIGDPWGIASILGCRAWLEIKRGNIEQAKILLHKSINLRHDINEMGGFAWCLEKFAEIAILEKDYRKATRLLGSASQIRQRIHSIIDPCDQPAYKTQLGQLKSALGLDVYETLWEEAQEMRREQILKYANG